MGNDEASVRKTVEAMAADERAKKHHVLAERLEQAAHAAVPKDWSAEATPDLSPGVEVIVPRRSLESLVLSVAVSTALGEVVEEQGQTELLRTHGLEPRHRVLLVGPPGNGKTSVAEALASALYRPLIRLRYEQVVGSFLGETAQRLAKAFEIARGRKCVLFLDEFDALAKERGDEHETGEIKRVVSSLLLLIDELPSHVVVVAASNHPELLDRAAARRFEVKLELPHPTSAQRSTYFDALLSALGGGTGYTSRRLADKTEGLSFSRLEEFSLDVQRRHLLAPNRDVRRLIDERLRRLAN